MTTSRRHALTHLFKYGLASALPISFYAQGQDKDSAGTNATAQSPLQQHLNTPRLVGQGKYSYWGFDVYWASLWSGECTLRPDQWQTQRLALELRYLRDFDGKDIAKRSIDEMHMQSPLSAETLSAWLKALEALFPNVRKGQSLTGIYVPNAGAQFLFNNKPLGTLADAELAKRFFAIWLSPQTSAPELRKKLFAEQN
jgi:hypothetical protein